MNDSIDFREELAATDILTSGGLLTSFDTMLRTSLQSALRDVSLFLNRSFRAGKYLLVEIRSFTLSFHNVDDWILFLLGVELEVTENLALLFLCEGVAAQSLGLFLAQGVPPGVKGLLAIWLRLTRTQTDAHPSQMYLAEGVNLSLYVLLRMSL